MFFIGHAIEETLIARDTLNFLFQQLAFVLNLNKSLLTPAQRIEFLGVTVDSLIMTLSLPEKKVKSSEAVLGISPENTSIDFRMKRTNRLIVFNYSSSTYSRNKFQVPTITTNTRIKNTGAILQKSDSKQKVRGRTAVVDKKFKNLQWSLLEGGQRTKFY